MSAFEPRDLFLTLRPCPKDACLVSAPDGVEPGSVVVQLALFASGRHLGDYGPGELLSNLENVTSPWMFRCFCAEAVDTTKT